MNKGYQKSKGCGANKEGNKFKNMIEINKNYNESNLETMAKMPDNFIDLTVTSPPYDNLRTYNGYSFDFENIAKELFRVTKQGGVVVWIVGDATVKGSKTGTSFKQVLYFMSCGFNLHDNMIWKKPNPIPTQSTRYQQEFEYMFVLSKGKPKTFNPIKVKSKCAGTKVKKHRAVKSSHNYNDEGIYTVAETKMIGNVWEIANVKNTSNHPAIFPEQLANDHIISWSNVNDLIYDPFMGSGTVAKMCILNNRNWIGSEISSEYCEIIEERIKKAWKEKSTKLHIILKFNIMHKSRESLDKQQAAQMSYDSLLATAALNGCEIVKCQYYQDGKCNDPNEYVNKQGESVCGRREDAILYEDYLEMMNDNPPMMSLDRPAEF